jgi:RNA polymerase sigma factor (sigma-70 family)
MLLLKARDQLGQRRADLMRRAQEGDAGAFRTLVEEMAPILIHFLRRRIPDSGELEDVCQEILLAIYQARHTYQPSRPLEPWLFAIARNVAADHFRRYWTRASWQELSDAPPEGETDGVEHIRVSLRQALNQLPQVQREAFVMLKVEGLPISEAAERTGISTGALKVRAHRAYEALKKAFLR